MAYVNVGQKEIDPKANWYVPPQSNKPAAGGGNKAPIGGGFSANAGLKGLAALQAQGGAVSSGISRPAGGAPIVEAKPLESPAMQGLQAAGEPAAPDMSGLMGIGGGVGMGAGPLRPTLGQRQPPMLSPLMGGLKY